MINEEEQQLTEQDLSESELIDQKPLEDIEDPPGRLAGYNQVPDFGDDIHGTLKESSKQASNR